MEKEKERREGKGEEGKGRESKERKGRGRKGKERQGEEIGMLTGSGSRLLLETWQNSTEGHF